VALAVVNKKALFSKNLDVTTSNIVMGGKSWFDNNRHTILVDPLGYM
jgi:hypothetical protein